MKKVLAMVLCSAMVASMLIGCGAKKEEVAEAATEAVEEATEAVVDEAAEVEEAVEEVVEEVSNDVKGEGVMTHEEYIAAALDSEVTVETYVQAKQSWWENSATLYTQDKDGAYFIYNVACDEADYDKLTPGTKIKVTGYKSEWSGEVEIVDGTFEIEEGDTFVADALDVTSLLGSDDLLAHQNEYVSFKDMTVEASKDANGEEAAFLYNWDGSGSQGDDVYFNVSSNGNTYTFTIESYLTGSDTDVYKAAEALKVGDKVDLTGFLYWYEGVNPHITEITVK